MVVGWVSLTSIWFQAQFLSGIVLVLMIVCLQISSLRRPIRVSCCCGLKPLKCKMSSTYVKEPLSIRKCQVISHPRPLGFLLVVMNFRSFYVLCKKKSESLTARDGTVLCFTTLNLLCDEVFFSHPWLESNH